MAGIVASAETDIDAPVQRVWQALTDPDEISVYMFGTRVVTDWEPGSPIVWQGEWQGKPYEDKGEVLEVDPPRRLSMTHFSPLSGAEDTPESYHTLVYSLTERDGGTHLELTQDGNGSDEEAGHATETWQQLLVGLRSHLEK